MWIQAGKVIRDYEIRRNHYRTFAAPGFSRPYSYEYALKWCNSATSQYQYQNKRLISPLF